VTTLPPSREELTRIAVLVVTRADLSIEQARTLYLFGPADIRIPQATYHVRTSLEAALTDARSIVDRNELGAVGNPDRSRAWIGAAGYLMLIDQISSVFDYGGFEKLLMSDLAGLSPAEAGAIYGLRNAFIHSYGLVNEPRATLPEARRKLLRHVFHLAADRGPLVELGDRTGVLTKGLGDILPTTVDLIRLGDLVEMIVREIRRRFLYKEELPWKVSDVDEFGRLSFFSHSDSITPGVT
jgi:hypothetical protein